MNYEIGEFSKITDTSIHTLRYYEKEKLIVPERKENGHRKYSELDVAWMELIKNLKDTGMPIKEIQAYAQLRAAGDSTMPQRIVMMEKHRVSLKKQIALLQKHLQRLDTKIAYCHEVMEKQGLLQAK